MRIGETLSVMDLVDVRLQQVPMDLRQRSVQHGEELAREMALISQQLGDADARAIPERLVRLVRDVRTTYAVYTAGPSAAMDAAVARGDPVVREIVYTVPTAAVDVVRWMTRVLEEADEFCRAGQHLLTLAAEPDVIAYRRWTLGEFERQMAGEPPMPWPEYAAQHGW